MITAPPRTERYARCIENSKKVRWEIDRDVIRGRSFDFSRKFLPEGLAGLDAFPFLDEAEKRLLSQVQGRTYANMFALCERFIAAKLMDLMRGQALGDQVVVESLVRSTDEELKHQALFRRLESMMAQGMPAGYAFVPEANAVADAVLSKSDWAILALTCHIEIFTLDHYRQSIEGDRAICPLWKDVFLFHMREEAQHAVVDELEWQRIDAGLTGAARDEAVTHLIELVGAVDGILQAQSITDAAWFGSLIGRTLRAGEAEALARGLLRAYRWQYIVSGAQNERFGAHLAAMCSPEQLTRISEALAPIVAEATAAAH